MEQKAAGRGNSRAAEIGSDADNRIFRDLKLFWTLILSKRGELEKPSIIVLVRIVTSLVGQPLGNEHCCP